MGNPPQHVAAYLNTASAFSLIYTQECYDHHKGGILGNKCVISQTDGYDKSKSETWKRSFVPKELETWSLDQYEYKLIKPATVKGEFINEQMEFGFRV